jgi:hypothetical protein
MRVTLGVVLMVGFVVNASLACSRRATPVARPAETRITEPPTPVTAASVPPPSVAAAPELGSRDAPNAREPRKQELRRVVNENVGHMHLVRGVNRSTIGALLNAVRRDDEPVLTELLRDEDKVVVRAVAMALLSFGPRGVSILQRGEQELAAANLPVQRAVVQDCLRDADVLAPRAAGAGDPFEQPPRGTVPNCGPDERKRVPGNDLLSTAVFVSFLRERLLWLGDSLSLDDFRSADGTVDWARVAASTEVSNLAGRTVYSLRFKPQGCTFYDLRVTSEGYTSLYGCCGK